MTVQEVRNAGASKGIALTTTAVRTPIPKGTDRVVLMPRNFSTAVVARFAFAPYLIVLKTGDDLATITDYTSHAQDGDASTDVDLSALDTFANSEYVLIGSHVPFAGLDVDVDGANGNASVLTVNYWDGSAWSTTSATDNTASGGATFAQDGTITWTVPSDWTKAILRATGLTPAAAAGPWQHVPLYWVRLQVSAALDAAVTLNAILAIERNTNYGEIISGEKVDVEVAFGPGGVSAISGLTDAGSANLIANCYSQNGFA